MTLTHLSLCSGIGGLDLAAEWAGFTTIGHSEIDEYASAVLAKNFKGVKNYGDIRTITNDRLTADGINKITVISAGFPCQPYSLAGKGKGDGDSRDLWNEVARVIRELKPKWFVGENTPGLFARAGQKYFTRILADLIALGYSVSWGIWGAYDAGAPHKRDRVFIVACAAVNGRFQGREKAYSGESVWADALCGDVSDTSCSREQRMCRSTGANDIVGLHNHLSNSAINIVGLFGGKSEIARVASCKNNNQRGTAADASRQWWQTEPAVGRVADGVPARVDRLRCLGNAVVPHQAYPIFAAISEYEKQRGIL